MIRRSAVAVFTNIFYYPCFRITWNFKFNFSFAFFFLSFIFSLSLTLIHYHINLLNSVGCAVVEREWECWQDGRVTLAIYKTTLTVTATALAVHAAIRCMEESLTLMKVEERGERESFHVKFIDLTRAITPGIYYLHSPKSTTCVMTLQHTRVRNRLNLLPKDKWWMLFGITEFQKYELIKKKTVEIQKWMVF